MQRTASLLVIVLLAGCALSQRASIGPRRSSSDWSRQDIIVADSTVGQMPVDKTVPQYPMAERRHGLGGGKLFNKTLDVSGLRARLREEGNTAALAELEHIPHCPQH